MRYTFLLLLMLAWAMFACKETPAIADFDTKTWKNDRLGCKGERIKLFPRLAQQQEKLKGLGQNQVLQLLGKPDVHELATRNQRFYIYYYKKGHQCQDGKLRIKQDTVFRIRFDAIDRVSEITF